MKKIINGKKYDTETAKLVGGWSNGRGDSFDWCEEELYQKRTGEFFIHGSGGPMSKYSVYDGNNTWSSGDEIHPITYAAAQKWAEKHLSADGYERIFGEIEEDESRTTITISVSASSVEKAKRAAAKANMSLSAYIESKI